MMKKTAMRWIALTVLMLCRCAMAGSDAEFAGALRGLKEHIGGKAALEADEINQQADILRSDMERIGSSAGMIGEAFALVEAYDDMVGPLFMNEATRKGFKRKPSGGLPIFPDRLTRNRIRKLFTRLRLMLRSRSIGGLRLLMRKTRPAVRQAVI